MSHIDATSASFQADVLDASASKLVFVDFWAPWCGPCLAMAPVLDELSNDPEFKDVLSIVKIDVDQYSDMAEKYEIQGIPNMKFFREGKVVGEVVGRVPKEVLVEEFRKHLK